jgi:hypothetical protein
MQNTDDAPPAQAGPTIDDGLDFPAVLLRNKPPEQQEPAPIPERPPPVSSGSPATKAQGDLVKTINVLIEKGDKAREKAEQFYVAAGQHLKTLKETTKTNAEWEALLKEKIKLSPSRASELLQIGDGRKTLTEVRAATAARVQRHKDRSSLVTKTADSDAKPVMGPVTGHGQKIITAEERKAQYAADEAAEGAQESEQAVGGTCLAVVESPPIVESEIGCDPKGCVLAVIGNAAEKADIAARNILPDFSKDELTEIIGAIDSLIDDWASLKRRLLIGRDAVGVGDGDDVDAGDGDGEEEESPRKRRSWKPFERQTTVADAVSEAVEELAQLASEYRDWYDNLPEGPQGSAKGEAVSEAADQLEQLETPNLPDTVGNLPVTITVRPKNKPSRSYRAGEAVDHIRTVCELLEAIPEGEDAHAEASELADALSEIVDAVDGVEFPGMYG